MLHRNRPVMALRKPKESHQIKSQTYPPQKEQLLHCCQGMKKIPKKKKIVKENKLVASSLVKRKAKELSEKLSKALTS
jgi:hypothetical protein